MSTTGENSLDRDLQATAAAAARPKREADLVARALELAVASRVDDRAWALVRLAADLRALQRFEDALRVLDVAWYLEPSEHPEQAMFSCAIATHCDRGTHELAVKLERSFSERGVGLKLARACVRLYAELCAVTEANAHRARRDSYRAHIEMLEAEQATVAA